MVPIYFAFPDGVFHYVCRECTLCCCHRSNLFDGHLEREIQTLVQLYPALENVAIGRRGNIVTFATPSGRCYFLTDDNLCGIEKEHGKALKPGCCRLFPFNRYLRIGKTVVISLNFTCLLRLQVPARPGEVEGTHSAIEAATRQSGYLEGPYYESFQQTLLHPAETAESALARERRFCDLCAQAIGQQSFSETLREAAADPARLDSLIARAGRLVGLSAPSEPRARDRIDDLLLALAPSLRLNMLYLSSESMLTALGLSELLLRRALTLSGDPPVSRSLADITSPKGAYEVLEQLGAAIRLLARGDEPTRLPKRMNRKAPPYGDAGMTFAAFKILRPENESRSTLEVLEEGLECIDSIYNRTIVLSELGHRFDHADAQASAGRRRKTKLLPKQEAEVPVG